MVVVDTSVVFKWFNKQESDRKQAIQILERHLSGRNTIVIPSLLLYEITNAWATKSQLPTEVFSKNLELLSQYGLVVRQLDWETMKQIGRFARRYSVSAYDATYAVLAQGEECQLITADTKFVNQVRLKRVIALHDI